MLKRLIHLLFGEVDKSIFEPDKGSLVDILLNGDKNDGSNSKDPDTVKLVISLRDKKNKDVINILKESFLNRYCQNSGFLFDSELRSYFTRFTTDSYEVINYYYQKIGVLNEPYNQNLWIDYQHPRLFNFDDDKYHLLESIALIEKYKYDENTTIGFSVRHHVTKRLLLQVLILFDIFCKHVHDYLSQSTFTVPGDIGSFKVENNSYFFDKYSSEFGISGVTKNMIINTFFSQAGVGTSDLAFIVRVLVSWKIPISSYLAGFDDGDLPSIPTEFENDVVMRQSRHLAAFVKFRLDNYRASPEGYMKGDDSIGILISRDMHLYVPEVFSFKDDQDLEFPNIFEA